MSSRGTLQSICTLKQSLKVDGIFAANINKPTLMYGIATLSK